MTLPMTPEIERDACEKASAVARSMGMSQDKIDEVKIAVIEACLNALQHSKATLREFELELSILGGAEPEALQISVRDTGVGFSRTQLEERKPEKPGLRKRGWGLQIIEGLMDEVRIESGASGTTVVMRKTR